MLFDASFIRKATKFASVAAAAAALYLTQPALAASSGTGTVVVQGSNGKTGAKIVETAADVTKLDSLDAALKDSVVASAAGASNAGGNAKQVEHGGFLFFLLYFLSAAAVLKHPTPPPLSRHQGDTISCKEDEGQPAIFWFLMGKLLSDNSRR